MEADGTELAELKTVHGEPSCMRIISSSCT
jgi:hypothetical protein